MLCTSMNSFHCTFTLRLLRNVKRLIPLFCMFPNTGSTVPIRLAYISRPTTLSNFSRITSIARRPLARLRCPPDEKRHLPLYRALRVLQTLRSQWTRREDIGQPPQSLDEIIANSTLWSKGHEFCGVGLAIGRVDVHLPTALPLMFMLPETAGQEPEAIVRDD